MSVPASLIPELEEVVERASPERRAETLKRITALFLDGASRFNEDHVRLFDDVFGRLIGEIESKARAELSNRLAPVGNAPVAVVRQLAHDDDISIAGPVLDAIPPARRFRSPGHREDQEPGASARDLRAVPASPSR